MANSPNPNPAHAPGAPVGRDQLALVSLLLSLIFPIGAALTVIAWVFTPTARSVALALSTLGNLYEIMGIPALIVAFVTGHMALRRAKRYPPQQMRQGLATAGLVLGYLSCLGAIGLIIWIEHHGILVHGYNGF